LSENPLKRTTALAEFRLMITPMPYLTRSDRIGSDVRPGNAEAGFTLIELMVVLLIMAILLAIAIPTFLGVANSAGDRAAQSNLTNALTEAKAIYQNGATYAPPNAGGTAIQLTMATFSSSAPEFSWVQGASTAGGGCSTTSNANCISAQVVDASMAGDGQGVILATYSPKTQTCWYAVDLEAPPATLNEATTGTPIYVSFTGTTIAHAQTGAATGGVFYAKKKGSLTGVNCNAFYPTTVPFNWGQSYSSSGTAG
jgi:prepilin-type N-terminal cleavage/methylation domain-containing protein